MVLGGYRVEVSLNLPAMNVVAATLTKPADSITAPISDWLGSST